MGMNRYEVIGNVGKAPVITTSPSGNLTIATFSIATNEYAGKDDQGQAKYETEWHTVKCFDQNAGYAKKHIAVGDTVLASGRHIVETWDKKDGSGKGYAAILQVGKRGSIERLSRRTDSNGSSAKPVAAAAADDELEIPF